MMSRKNIIPYNPKLVPLAKKLRQNMTLSEVLIWQEIKNKQLGVRFSRQIPVDEYIVDFYCKELMLAIEIDGVTHTHENQPEKDLIRQKRLESFGISFIRFDDLDVKTNLRWVVNEILFRIENPPPPLQGGE